MTLHDVQHRLRPHEEAASAEVSMGEGRWAANIVPAVQQGRFEGESTLSGRINISTGRIVNM